MYLGYFLSKTTFFVGIYKLDLSWRRDHGFGSNDLKCSDYGSLRFLFRRTVTFQIIVEHNCENTTAENARNKDKGGFLV